MVVVVIRAPTPTAAGSWVLGPKIVSPTTTATTKTTIRGWTFVNILSRLEQRGDLELQTRGWKVQAEEGRREPAYLSLKK